MGTVSLGLEIEEEALSEVLFVFDNGNERGIGHRERILKQ